MRESLQSLSDWVVSNESHPSTALRQAQDKAQDDFPMHKEESTLSLLKGASCFTPDFMIRLE
jgi:hypothetical protein